MRARAKRSVLCAHSTQIVVSLHRHATLATTLDAAPYCGPPRRYLPPACPPAHTEQGTRPGTELCTLQEARMRTMRDGMRISECSRRCGTAMAPDGLAQVLAQANQAPRAQRGTPQCVLFQSVFLEHCSSKLFAQACFDLSWMCLMFMCVMYVLCV